MANPSKDKGTRAETAVARYLQAHGVAPGTVSSIVRRVNWKWVK